MSGRRRARLARLAPVTGAMRAAALARLSDAIAARRAVEAEIAALDDQRRAAAEDVADPATRAGITLLWQRWAEDRRGALNRRLARARLAEEEARIAARRATGRDEARARLERGT